MAGPRDSSSRKAAAVAGGPARVAEDIRHRAAEVLRRSLRDPRLEGVTITRCEVTRDLGRATLYFRTLPGMATRTDVEEAASHAAGFLRKEIARTLRLRAVPEIVLTWDELPDEGNRIEQLLAESRGGRAVEPSAAEGSGPRDLPDPEL